jgi:hypothetical protein
MNRLALVAMMGLICVGTGCATFRGDKQKMTIATDPAGANLTVGDQKYTTPAEVTLKRKEAHLITVAKDGYQPVKFNFQATWDGASMTDVALPGGSALMGLSVATGSDLQFNQLETIKLQKASSPNPPVVEVYQYRGKLLSKAEYDRQVAEDAKDKTRFMGPENN